MVGQEDGRGNPGESYARSPAQNLATNRVGDYPRDTIPSGVHLAHPRHLNFTEGLPH